MLKNALHFLLYNHVFFGFCALAQVLVSYSFLKIAPNFSVCAIVFCATICVYNFKSLNNLATLNKNNGFKIWLNLSCFLVIVFLFFKLYLPAKILLLFLAAICYAYYMPFVPFFQKKLRKINGLKLGIIALVWALTIVLLPVLQANVFVNPNMVILQFLQQLVFFTIISILFDIKDLHHDKENNLTTVATFLGVKKTYLLCKILILVYVLPLMFMSFSNNSISVLLTAVLIFIFIENQSIKKNIYFYPVFLDGVLLAQYLFLCVINFFR